MGVSVIFYICFPIFLLLNVIELSVQVVFEIRTVVSRIFKILKMPLDWVHVSYVM